MGAGSTEVGTAHASVLVGKPGSIFGLNFTCNIGPELNNLLKSLQAVKFSLESSTSYKEIFFQKLYLLSGKRYHQVKYKQVDLPVFIGCISQDLPESDPKRKNAPMRSLEFFTIIVVYSAPQPVLACVHIKVIF